MAIANLKIGARGWRHKPWLANYYPVDLPEDWQLTYYANDFEVVLVPQDYWLPSTGYALQDWSAAVSDNFRFYLELPPLDATDEMKRFQRQCESLGDLLGGVLITESASVAGLVLSCPVVELCAAQNSGLCVGLMEKDFADLRKARIWLAAFDENCQAAQRVVFVSNGKRDEIPVDNLVKLQKLAQLMGL